ncbi:hypothetical protein PHLCEN_2v11621 [Hermanssonia centrifuga]|uniref:RNA-directed DNA polymerase n=1 Tax=Hermanssonia centrifuga TaxID=98765 RepID=A0A2R6NJN6_9APHY|nr:hypothetical protein PHLCEN_2v11621 [Hermanssonia centrifuga]
MKGSMEDHGHLGEQNSVGTHMYTDCDSNTHIFDLYSVGPGPTNSDEQGRGDNTTQPFLNHIAFHGPQGEIVRVKALIDDGAMVNAMCVNVWNLVQHRLGEISPSKKRLRMANGTIIPSEGRWQGTIEWGEIRVQGVFEIFPSGGNWSFLFGKPLLHAFRAIHDYDDDSITLRDCTGRRSRMKNQVERAINNATLTAAGLSLLVDIKLTQPYPQPVPPPNVEPVWHIELQAPDGIDTIEEPGVEIPDLFEEHTNNQNIYTRHTEPWKPARVAAILQAITIGPDLTIEERNQVKSLVAEYADCFALSVSEVTAVPDAIHRLNIPEGASFNRKIHQRPLTPPQRTYLNKKVDEMLAAGVIEQCKPDQVKCVSPTTLAQKAHEGGGLTLDELRTKVNEQCTAAGLQLPYPNTPNRHTEVSKQTRNTPKWRICQNFSQVNKLTEVAPMPQGDIRLKQQNLSGHRWVSTFDFASGFYAVTMAEESRPYTCFYVEGRGYFWYLKMPFGLTGAPSTFAHLTAAHLHDLITDGTMELFVDDGGTGGSEFSAKLSNIRRILTRVREKRLSLSAAKLQLFMTTLVFGGASVGPNGVTTDAAKLTAIVDWEKPSNALQLSSFLGVTGHFRDLIRGYSKIEGPLRDILKAATPPKNSGKSAYRRALASYSLGDTRWGKRQTDAFIALKVALTSEPVLRRPVWDGTPFIITSDGCKDGFGAVLTQRSQTVLPNGRTVDKLHPIAFASKRTSRSEEKYKPFLLELAALKFALDKFSDIVWGFPIEIETDCSALRYVITNDKLNDTHSRWRDSVLAHQIIDVRHIPGRTNVADGFSREGEGHHHKPGDGSDWTVQEDWEHREGLDNDILLVENAPANRQLLQRFEQEPLFLDVIKSLQDIEDSNIDERTRQRAKHRASQYMIEDGRLWKVRGGTKGRPRARVECRTQHEAKELAAMEHATGGHWGRDAVKLALLDRICSPKLDQSIMDAISECGKCKNFGSTHLHSLLDPITRRKPFELIVGDYLSMPTGKGGFTNLGVFLDTFSQHVWVFKHKTAGTSKTTIDSLTAISRHFTPPETFMSDGGKHFDSKEVREFCLAQGTKPHIVSAYSPWVNGLVEGTNKLLLHILKRLCAPDLGEDECNELAHKHLPKNWTEHLDAAVHALNNRVLSALQHTPKELLLGLPIERRPTPLEQATSAPTADDADVHFLYAEQQRLDGYNAAVHHATKRKDAFDKRVVRSRAGDVTFANGSLVQIYRNDLDNTHRTERKILPKWSEPRRITGCTGNSYTVETLDGSPINAHFHARRLRAFQPRMGTMLALNESRRSHAHTQPPDRVDILAPEIQ